MPLNSSRVLLPLLTTMAAAPVVAQAPYSLTVMHVNTPGHPTNLVPGLGIPFHTGGTGTSAFERPTFSADGLQFAINVVADSATTDDDVLLLNGAPLLREGSPTPWSGGFNIGTINPFFAINSSGSLLINHNSSSTTNDDYILLYQASTWSILAQEGGSVHTVVGGLTGNAGDTATWDDTLDCCGLTETHTALWRATGVDGLATTPTTLNDALVVIGSTALQKGVSAPLGQAGGATNAWEVFDASSVDVSADGSLVLVQGDLLGATTSDDVLVLNGTVVIQEGVALPGFATTVSAINEAWIDHANSWYARGSNLTTGFDWLLRNGVQVAQTDGTDPIVPGSSEHWDDASFSEGFFAMDGNSLGHFVIAGVTDAASTSNGVIVFDDGLGNRYVAVREGDPVDLNGNGLDDDDRYYNTFGDDDVRLLDDGSIVFVATLRTGAGTAVDQGLFKLVPRTASCTFRNGTGINPVACTCLTLPIVGTTWNIDVSSGPQTIGTLLLADVLAIPPFPVFGGELLIAPAPFVVPTSMTLPRGWHGLNFSLQGVRLDFNGVDLLIVLTNAQDAVLGY